MDGVWRCDCSPPLIAAHYQVKKISKNQVCLLNTFHERRVAANVQKIKLSGSLVPHMS